MLCNATEVGVYSPMLLRAIQVLRNADFPEKSVTKMYGSTLLALRRGGWVSNFQEKVLRNT